MPTPGVLVGYKGRETKFWYPCPRERLKEVLAGHHHNWKLETVREGEEDVQREIPIADLTATYCQGWKKANGKDEMIDPEPVDVVKILVG